MRHSFRRTRFSTFFIPIAFALALAGLVFEYGGFTFLAVFCYLAITVVLTVHSGFEIDSEHKMQRYYISYLGAKFGRWEELKSFDRITVRKIRRQRNTAHTWKNVQTNSYAVYLFTGTGRDTVGVYQTGVLEFAAKVADRLKAALPEAEIKFD